MRANNSYIGEYRLLFMESHPTMMLLIIDSFGTENTSCDCRILHYCVNLFYLMLCCLIIASCSLSIYVMSNESQKGQLTPTWQE